MEPDLEFISLQSLQVLNNSLTKMRAEAILKLHALQKTNHDLLTENARLRQHAREALRRHQERSIANNNHTEATRRPELPIQQPVGHREQSKHASINVQLGPDFTAVVETRILLSPAQLKAYLRAEPSNFQYTMIMIEIRNGIVEHASTIVTKNSKITLRKLQNDMLYHITAHMVVPQGARRLTTDTKFVYHQKYATYSEPQKGVGAKSPEEESPISVNQQKYTLNVQIADEEYITCNFTDSDDLRQEAGTFAETHKLKPVLIDGLVKAMKQLMESNVTISSVDVADLL